MELTGRVTGNAVISITKSGKGVVEFSIAINDYYKPKGATEGRQVTQYVECSYWINTAVAAKLVRGVVAELSGRISVQPYIGKDGTAKASLKMHCNSVKVHSSGSGQNTRNELPVSGNNSLSGENNNTTAEVVDDIPF